MSKITMKNSDIEELYFVLGNLPKITVTAVSYAIMRNFEKAGTEYKRFEKNNQPFDAYKEYEKELLELQEKHAEKNESGKPKVEWINNQMKKFTFIDPEAFKKEFDELKEKHKPAIDEREVQNEQIKKFMEQRSDFEPYMIKLELLLDEKVGLDQQQLFGIRKLIEE